MDGKMDLLGVKMLQMGEEGPGTPSILTCTLPSSCSAAAVECRCREETAVQLQGQGPTGELAAGGHPGRRRGGERCAGPSMEAALGKGA